MRELRQEQYGGCNYAIYENGELMSRHQLNKRELRAMHDEIQTGNLATKSQTTAYTRRRIVLASRSQGSQTGRAWVADGYAIDKYSLPPDWEGELICYSYGSD